MSNQEFRPSRFQILPPVVKNILIINCIFFLATSVIKEKFGYDLADYLGLHYFTSDYFRPHQFVTYLFMHGSLAHIFFNMFALWMFGNVLENFWGTKRFLIFYLVTGVGAGIIQELFTWYDIEQMRSAIDTMLLHANPMDFNLWFAKYENYLDPSGVNQIHHFIDAWKKSPLDPVYIQNASDFAHQLLKEKIDIPSVGASGAVFGILLAFGMMFPNTILYIYFALPIKAKWFVLFYGLSELFLGVQNSPGDNVAHFAHLGGMLFGYFMIQAWKQKRYRN